MVEVQLEARGIHDQRVLKAMAEVPRHLFVSGPYQDQAYEDQPLPIGFDQTISQPYMVATMVEALELQGDEVVLEVGTGSGYQTAILSLLAKKVYSVEIIPELAEVARERLRRLGYENVEVVLANGSLGWREGAPYNAIVVAAAAPEVPESLLDQLQERGRIVLPVGSLLLQNCIQGKKEGGKVHFKGLGTCSFVPLLGEEGWKKESPTPAQ
jgi:protein-L-isoaspartate(D-aspartate) O-methyltransferase